MPETSLKELSGSQDPLCDEAMSRLLQENEEHLYVDYKEGFEDDEKHWLDLTKDICAFANTDGGYLVFGVRDKTWELVGLDESTALLLSRTDMVKQKVNRHVGPTITLVRTKHVTFNDLGFVVMHTPPSKTTTHIVIKQGQCKWPSGKEHVILRPGNIFIRTSAGNGLIDDPFELNRLVERRLNYFREALLNKIARVVEAPAEDHIVIYSRATDGEDGQQYVIRSSSDPDFAGTRRFVVLPETAEEEVEYWVSKSQKQVDFLPQARELWSMYHRRSTLHLDKRQKAEVMRFCVYRGVSAFYWMQGLSAEDIRETLLRVPVVTLSGGARELAEKVPLFVGRSFQKEVAKKLGRTGPCKVPQGGVQQLFSPQLVTNMLKQLKHRKLIEERKHLQQELDSYASSLAKNPQEVILRRQAWAIDCYLYARDDKYQAETGPLGHTT